MTGTPKPMHPVLRNLHTEIQRLKSALEESRATATHWEDRAKARGHALRQANDTNRTLVRIINEKLDG